ncbi:MAG: hypothetical protein A4E57_02519 [Syntrophorhabdaceae bacterium PtaU1.Bin034]|nr:MAG: hypothetical protein A4E57_02519 [Syntrophorhabdaceae bacterium PtaU1.Bin034]
MERLSKQTLKRLVGEHAVPCVSIFLQTHRIATEEKLDRTKFGNLLHKSEEQLALMGLRSVDSTGFLRPARELLDPANDLFWQHQDHGLAVFLSPGFFRYFHLSYSPRETAIVSDSFHLKPLLPLFSGNSQFYVLALSVRETRLFHGTPGGMSMVDPASMPNILAKALESTGLPDDLPFPPGSSDRSRNLVLKHFQEIRTGIDELLAGEKVPLVLAGTDYLPALYREVNKYPHLLSETVVADPAEVSDDELFKTAWSIAERHFQGVRRLALDRYKSLLGTSSTSRDIKEIVPAAFYGRTDVSFLSDATELWGKFDAADGTVRIEDKPGTGTVDLLDFTAAHTFLHGGTAFVLAPEKVPDRGPVAAIFRY